MSARTILHMEDDPGDAFFVQRAFTRANAPFTILRAQDGEEGVAYLAGKGPYADRSRYPLPVAVLLDLKMPRRDGYQVLEWIRSQESLKNLAVIVLTSSSLRYDEQRVMLLGATAFLTKSPQCDNIPEAVQRILASSGQGRP